MGDREQLTRAFAEAQSEIALQAQQQLTEKMLRLCFKRCVSAPDARLSDKQRRCLDACTSSFLEGFSIASDTLSTLAKKQSSE